MIDADLSAECDGEASPEFAPVRTVVMPDAKSLQAMSLRDGRHQTQIHEIVHALDAVERYASPADLASGLTAAVQAARRLVTALRSTLTEEVNHQSIESQSPAQTYFHIRSAALDRSELLLQIALLAERTMNDLIVAPLAANDTDLILSAFRSILNEFVPIDGFVAPRLERLLEEPSQRTATSISPSETWWARWVIAHQVHALLNTFAAAALLTAAESAESSQWANVTERLRFATTLVAAFGPTRAHALCLPPEHYQTVLRPSMTPPLFPVALSGRMHLEYKAYRESVLTFLEAVPSSIAELIRIHPELALTREQLLEADMAEAERHISLVWSMIGTDKSIVQSPRLEDNAISALRLIRDRRAALISPYVRYGGSVASRTVGESS